MKKMSYLSTAVFIVCIGLLAACSPSKVASPDGGNVNLRGTWTVSNIDLDGVSKSGFKVTVFDDAPYTCFVGSQWNLVPNGNGSYTVPSGGTDCSAGERKIYWSVQTVSGTKYFQFKKLYEGEKPKNVTDGYRLQLRSLTANSMVLQSAVDFEGKTVYINYQFSR